MASPRRSSKPESRTEPGLHRIAAVARKTGVSEHVLRIWERRYGTLASQRSSAGYRLFSDADVARVSTLKELVDGGHSIGDVASLPIGQLEKLRAREMPYERPPDDPLEFARELRARVLEHVRSFEVDEARGLLVRGSRALPRATQLEELFAPLFADIGLCWEDGTFTIAQEHAASALMRGMLDDFLRTAKRARGARTMVATTPPGELHEFGALLAAASAANAGASVLYLGPNLPCAEVAAAARRSNAEVVLLSLVYLQPSRAQASIAELRRALPAGVELWVGGAAVRSAPPSGVQWLRTLREVSERARAPGKRAPRP